MSPQKPGIGQSCQTPAQSRRRRAPWPGRRPADRARQVVNNTGVQPRAHSAEIQPGSTVFEQRERREQALTWGVLGLSTSIKRRRPSAEPTAARPVTEHVASEVASAPLACSLSPPAMYMSCSLSRPPLPDHSESRPSVVQLTSIDCPSHDISPMPMRGLEFW